MKDVRELVGALTQARVQMLAAKAVIEEHENEEEDEAVMQALALDAQKLSRCMGVIRDVRERYARPAVGQAPPKQEGELP